jgi:CubicO group peptidase (beta-lactamase class C family)
MASHSKLFTATAIMQLCEQGKVRLDPSRKYLLWFKVRPATDDDGDITVEQLLSHSSGLPREAGDHWTSFDFPTADEFRACTDRRALSWPRRRLTRCPAQPTQSDHQSGWGKPRQSGPA